VLLFVRLAGRSYIYYLVSVFISDSLYSRDYLVCIDRIHVTVRALLISKHAGIAIAVYEERL
jgi:hypothetical protein